jgi:hypothetical protein
MTTARNVVVKVGMKAIAISAEGKGAGIAN